MMKDVTPVFASFVCALIASAAVAEGSDRKIYAATNCQTAAGSEGTAYYSTNGRVYNTSTTDSLWLICPIVRDSTIDPWLELSVVARNSADEDVSIWCIAESRTASGALDREDNRYLSTASGTSWETLSFEPGPSADYAFYQIRCGLPRHSGQFAPGIASYSVVEGPD